MFTCQTFVDLVAADVPEVVADPGNGEGPVVLSVIDDESRLAH